MQILSCKQKIQIINLKWLLFLTDGQILHKFNRVQAVDDIDKLCKFHENLTMMQTVSSKQEMQIFQRKMGTFLVSIYHFFHNQQG